MGFAMAERVHLIGFSSISCFSYYRQVRRKRLQKKSVKQGCTGDVFLGKSRERI